MIDFSLCELFCHIINMVFICLADLNIFCFLFLNIQHSQFTFKFARIIFIIDFNGGTNGQLNREVVLLRNHLQISKIIIIQYYVNNSYIVYCKSTQQYKYVWREGTLGCKLHWYPMFYNVLFEDLKFWVL